MPSHVITFVLLLQAAEKEIIVEKKKKKNSLGLYGSIWVLLFMGSLRRFFSDLRSFSAYVLVLPLVL
jgi:hypothetical protein